MRARRAARVNALLVDGETKAAEVTVPGGRILDLAGGDVQVVEGGPRDGSPIVLIHCFTCAIDWWDGMMPGCSNASTGSSRSTCSASAARKSPTSGYSIEDQADAGRRSAGASWACSDATVVGHSLGGAVATALAERPRSSSTRLVIIDQAPDNDATGTACGFTAKLTFQPVIGQALWRIKPDFAIKDGLAVAFAPATTSPTPSSRTSSG